MVKGYNAEKRFFAQSYEDLDILDSSLLIMPLVFFSTPVRASSIPPLLTVLSDWLADVHMYSRLSVGQADPRFLNTLKAILQSPESGGLTSNVRPISSPHS